ncbi:MAG: hypothetical protein ACI33K_02925 [Clostridiaceae bacterium]
MRNKYLLILCIFLILGFTGCSKSNTDIKQYLNSGNIIDKPAKEFMPSIENLPKYKAISYNFNSNSKIFLKSEAITLVVQYDGETYEKEKERLTKAYKFLEEKAASDPEEIRYYVPEHEFSISNFDFKVADNNHNYKADYPKSFGMVGTSDMKRSIAYLYFYDSDLDSIEDDTEEPMASFVKEYFKYEF